MLNNLFLKVLFHCSIHFLEGAVEQHNRVLPSIKMFVVRRLHAATAKYTTHNLKLAKNHKRCQVLCFSYNVWGSSKSFIIFDLI